MAADMRGTKGRARDPQVAAQRPLLVPVLALGLSLGVFFVISYALCVLFYLWFPDLVSGHAVLSLFLPGFKLLSWSSLFLGLVESFAYGWYIALIFGPIYNLCARRLG